MAGAGQGIGKRAALAYLEADAKVVLAALDDDNLTNTAAKFESQFPACTMSFACDVTSQHSVDALIEATVEQFGRLDIGVANAGVVTLIGLDKMGLDEFEPLTDLHALWEPQIPIRRLGKPEELMGLYLCPASDTSTYMTGSDVIIDGGFTTV